MPMCERDDGRRMGGGAARRGRRAGKEARPAGRPYRWRAGWRRAALALALLPAPLCGQEAQDLADLSLEELMQVEVVFAASRREEDPRAAPFPVFIVTREEIRAHGCRTLADVLERVPGFLVTNDRNYRYLGVRGLGRMGDYNAHVLVLLNGVRVNENVYDYVGLGGDFPVEMELVARVEVVVGPSASLYGASAFFAVVNVVTRHGRELAGGELQAAAGSFGSRAGRASYGDRLDGGLELVASLSATASEGPRLYYQEFDAPETNHGVTRGTDDESHARLFARLGWRGLTLQASHVGREKGIPTGAYGTVFGEPRNRTFDSQTQLDLAGERSFGRRATARLAFNLGSARYQGDYLYQASPNVVNRDDARGDWWRLESALNLEAGSHTLAVGAEWQANRRLQMRNRDLEPERVYLDSRARGERWALYAQDQARLGGGLSLSAGLRHDGYSTFGGATSPRLGLVFRPSAAFAMKALYGRAFRAPNEYELRYTLEDQVPPQRGNPALRPETIDTAELVVERDLAPGVSLTGSAYHSEIRELIGAARDEDGVLVFRNADRICSSGLELALRVRRGGLRGRASYAFQRTRGAEGERLVGSPSHLAHASVSWPLGDRVGAAVDARYVSSRLTLAGRTTGDVFLADVTLLARLLPGRLEARAAVRNLFDRAYGDPGSDEHPQDVLMQDGRTFRVDLTLRF